MWSKTTSRDSMNPSTLSLREHSHHIIFDKMRSQIYHVKQRSLHEINAILGLRNRRARSDDIAQIINELRTNYDYQGEFNTHYIREFLKVYNMDVSDPIDELIQETKLRDLLDDDKKYRVDEQKYKQLINPRYNEAVRQRAIIELEPQQLQDNEQQNDDEQNNFLANKDTMADTEPFPRLQMLNPAQALQNLRRQSTARIGTNINHVNLQDAINAYQQRRRQVNPNLHPRAKQNKLGITGMDDLVRVVVNLKNDVKQIKEAQSVASAQDWIDRHGYQNLYDVVEEDLDGDNFPEVVVKDKTGKKVIVNGYTTEPSLFPYRREYYSTHPTKESRKNKPWKNFIKTEFYNPTYDATGRGITGISEAAAQFDELITDNGYTRTMKPKNRSTYQVFTSRCIAPFYQALRYLNLHVPFKLAQLSAYVWKEIVRDPALSYVYGEAVLQVTDKKELAKLCSKQEVKDAIENIAVPILTQARTIFDNVLPIVIDVWRNHGYNLNGDQVRDFILVARAIMFGEQLPAREAFEAWKVAYLRQHPDIFNDVHQMAAEHDE